MIAASYADCVRDSVKATWQIDDLLRANQKLDFSRAHLPEALVAIDALDFLTASEKLALNHIRGNAYMNLFAFVEEYIIPQVVQHAHAELFGDQEAVRALLRFAEEEVKHQALFRRYCDSFNRDFGAPVEVLQQSIAVAQIILSKAPMAAMLTTLHLELITQQHYVSSVKGDRNLDPTFSAILKHHWQEEAQHAKIDQLELAKMVEVAEAEQRDTALADYFDILTAFDGLLAEQTAMDARSLEAKTGRRLNDDERARFVAGQHHSYRSDFIFMGLEHADLVAAATALSTDWNASLAEHRRHYAS